MKLIRKIFIVMLASAGIRLDKITDGRIDAFMYIIVGFACHTFIAKYISFPLALTYFLVLFAIRYIFLFGGFVQRGFSGLMIEKYGEEKAWSMYETLTSIMFFQRGLSFGLLTQASEWSILSLLEPVLLQHGFTNLMMYKSVMMGLGFTLVLIGFWVNVSATFVIGIDTYYYKDLFIKRPVVDFKVEGPYRYFSNPMYGIGQASGYGAALMVGSLEGILGTLLNQIMMYLFYFIIEKPHIKLLIFNSSVSKIISPNWNSIPIKQNHILA
jgi:hypothetical protein